MIRLLFVLIAMLLTCIAAPTVGWAADDAAGHAAPTLREDLSLWGFVAFVLFFATCFKLLGPWAVQSLSERERTENALIDDAERKNRHSQEMLAERRGRMEAIGEEIDERLAEAGRDAEHTRRDIASIAEREAETLRNRAAAEINRTRNQALNDLFSTMASRVVEQTESKLKARLNDDVHNRLIDETLNHFASS
ncbi:MAG: hypothetical protein AB7U20_03715 [Planctomycetaceae bacterium]